jgi:hypothetical protein
MYGAAFRAYCVRPDAVIVPTLEVSWPDGTVGRYSTAEWDVAGVGTFARQAPADGFGDSVDGFDPLTANLEGREITVTLIDNDREIMKRLERYDCRRSRAVAKHAAPALGYGDWETLLDGILDRWSYHDGGLVDLVIRTDARWMDCRAPKFALSPAEWEGLPNASRGIYLPTPFGSHDGQSLSAKGFWPTTCVRFAAGTLRWDLICHGGTYAVPRVYLHSGGTVTLKTSGVDYAVEGYLVGGKWCVVVRWLPGHIPAADDTVQVDIDGMTTIGPGGGALVTNPVQQLRLWAVNFGYGSWRAGAGLPDSSAPIDSAWWSMSEAYAAAHHLEGSWGVGGTTAQGRVEDVFRRWLETWPMFRPWWTPAGKLAILPLALVWPGMGSGDAFDLVREDDCGQLPTVEDDSTGLISSVSLAHLYEAATGKSWASLDVQDPSRPEGAESVAMEYGSARFA